jgi:FkbM family methyltransferase
MVARWSAWARERTATMVKRSPLGLWPVRVRQGVAAGARWTLFPWTSSWRGTHEPAVQAALMNLGGGNIEGWSCWDLGAHFGLYTVGLAKRVGPTGQVAAFEPNPLSFARLTRHCRMNQLHWAKLYQAAVSDRHGQAELYTYGDLGATTTHLPYAGEARTDDIGALKVRTLSLDELVRSGELRAPQFVKVDVEGHGHQVMAGMTRTLAAARPIFLVAFHSAEEISGFMEPLRAFDYTWREIGPSTPSRDIRSGADYLLSPRKRA